MDGTIKKESDLPAADPNTPIPLKYEDRSAIGAAEQDMSLLLERGQSTDLISKDDGYKKHTFYDYTVNINRLALQ